MALGRCSDCSALLAVVPPCVAGGCGGADGDGGCRAAERPRSSQVVDPDDTEGYDYEYVIPFGTGRRLDGGEEIEIVPGELNVKVGEKIRIVNEDVRGAAVGIFWVPAERTVAMEFTTPGTLTGECDVHPSGVFTINVEADRLRTGGLSAPAPARASGRRQRRRRPWRMQAGIPRPR